VSCELIVDVRSQEIAIAVLEDKRLLELQREARGGSFAVGDIFLGKVKKTMSGLNAAFVDVGYEKDAFLHYQDIGPYFTTYKEYLQQIRAGGKAPEGEVKILPEINKTGSIVDFLKTGQEILVQVTKEPISTKGPRLTSELSFAGRYMVLVPFGQRLSISAKIRSRVERARLQQLVQSIKPKDCSLILRTSSEGARVSELDAEIKELLRRWEEILAKLVKAKPATVIHEEKSRILALIRDIVNADFKHVYVNDHDVFCEVRDYIHSILPDSKPDLVREHKSKVPLFDYFGVTTQTKSAFSQIVNIKHGAYLIIEQTEAMHVIDVNSGPRSVRIDDEADTVALSVNLAAAEEIARQLRLRDLGGIIVVDFIDLKDISSRQSLYEYLKQAMDKDRAKHNILPLSKFGLMQLTRQRVRQATNINTGEICPTCLGKGKVQRPSLFFIEDLERVIVRVVKQCRTRHFSIHLHPYVAAYMNKGLVSKTLKWRFLYAFGLRITPDQLLGLLEYRVYDADKNEITFATHPNEAVAGIEIIEEDVEEMDL
jgi:ribonuclease G